MGTTKELLMARPRNKKKSKKESTRALTHHEDTRTRGCRINERLQGQLEAARGCKRRQEAVRGCRR